MNSTQYWTDEEVAPLEFSDAEKLAAFEMWVGDDTLFPSPAVYVENRAESEARAREQLRDAWRALTELRAAAFAVVCFPGDTMRIESLHALLRDYALQEANEEHAD